MKRSQLYVIIAVALLALALAIPLFFAPSILPSRQRIRTRTPSRTRIPAPPVPIGAIWFVDSVNGNDSNPGTSAQPWATIQHAVATIASGDTVRVRNGTYTHTPGGSITFGPAGTAGRLTTFIADTGARPLVTRTDSLTPQILFTSYVHVEGFYIGGLRNVNASPVCVCLGGSPINTGIEFIGNTVFNFVEGTSGGSVQYSLIRGNRYVNNGYLVTNQHSIYLSGDNGAATGGSSNHMIVDNNIIIGGENYGIQGFHTIHDMIYTRNFVTRQTYGSVTDGSDHLIANNFFWDQTPGTLGYAWGYITGGTKQYVVNNIFGPNSWLNTDSPSRFTNGNSFVTNGFDPNTSGLGQMDPFGTGITLTVGLESSQIGISETTITNTVNALKTSFSAASLATIMADSTIEPNFATLANITMPTNSPLYNAGFDWVDGTGTTNIGQTGKVPGTTTGYWNAFYYYLGLANWDRCDNSPPNPTTCP